MAEEELLTEQQAGIRDLTEDDVREMFVNSTVEEQRRFIRMLIGAVFVRRGKEPLADRIEIAAKPVMWRPRDRAST